MLPMGVSLNEHDDLPETLPGIHLPTALKLVSGNKRLFRKMLLDFADSSGNSYLEISALLARGDTIEAGRLAHNLKGNAGIIGAAGLHQAARMLEESLKEADPKKQEETLALLSKELRLVLEASKSISTKVD